VTTARGVTAALLLAAAAPAAAASFGVEATSDLRRRGISWSDGRPTIEVYGSVPVVGGLSVEAGAAALRDSRRHGGAKAMAEASLRYTHQQGPWRLWGEAQGHGFAGGAAGQGYAELRAGTALGLGPAQLSLQGAWVPPQNAIGGANLYFGGQVSVGVVGTPLTLSAAAGRSTGNDDGSGRSARLRPGGDYTDVRIDADYVRGPLSLGVSFTATTIDSDQATDPNFADDVGSRILLRAGIRF
jgi:hypothetical protein